MRAVRIAAPRQAEIVEVADPDATGPSGPSGEPHAIVRLERACLCGSDRPFFIRDFRTETQLPLRRHYDCPIPSDPDKLYPLITGLSIHECVGTVVSSRSERFAEGDFVLALPFLQYGFMEHLQLPESRLFPLPRDAVTREEVLMSQPLGTILRAFHRIPNVTGATVAVVGQGPIGQMMNRLLRHYGAARVIALDPHHYRLEIGRTMGATDVVNPTESDPVEAVRELTGGTLCDLAIEAAGHDELATDLAAGLARQDGHLLQFGVFDEETPANYPAETIFRRNLTVINSVGAAEARYFRLARDLIAGGRFDVKPIITHTFPMTQAQQAYETFVGRKDGCLKVIIDFESD